MTRLSSLQVWSRRVLDMAVILGIVMIAPGWNTNLLRKSSFVNTAKAATNSLLPLHSEQAVVLTTSSHESKTKLGDEGPMPELGGAIGWLNSVPLSSNSLRGKVVLVNIWTYTCIYSLRPQPYLKSWAAKYKDAGLVVIGVHTPEFSFEGERVNVENAVRSLNLTYPIAIDSNRRIWEAFNNEYWPAQYLIDGKGRIRYHHFGEGEYGELERTVQALLKENGADSVDGSLVTVSANGIEAPPSKDVQSPETYVGYGHAERFSSPGTLAHDSVTRYTPPAKPSLNRWGLGGSWNVGSEGAVLQSAPGKIVFRFHARDLHFILGPTKDGKPVRFKVRLDGTAPANDHGADSAPDGTGEIRESRLYQLIRQKGAVKDRTFEIEFLDPGAQAFDFTFG